MLPLNVNPNKAKFEGNFLLSVHIRLLKRFAKRKQASKMQVHLGRNKQIVGYRREVRREAVVR